MATFWGNNPSAVTTYAVGDVFVGTVGANTNTQRRYVGPGLGDWSADGTTLDWKWIVPPETRADTAPIGGALNTRLSKGHANSWNLTWLNAADGVVFTTTRAPGDAANVWLIVHNLSARFVDVSVMSPGNNDPSAEQTVIVPEITFSNTASCSLSFAEPVSGTAVVRR